MKVNVGQLVHVLEESEDGAVLHQLGVIEQIIDHRSGRATIRIFTPIAMPERLLAAIAFDPTVSTPDSWHFPDGKYSGLSRENGGRQESA